MPVPVPSQSPEGSIYMELGKLQSMKKVPSCLSRPKAQSTWNFILIRKMGNNLSQSPEGSIYMESLILIYHETDYLSQSPEGSIYME